jgi:hypothetical protein
MDVNPPGIVAQALTPREAATLAALEQTVAKGVAAFVEVGEALEAIRDSRLYRATHRSFEAYCAERWNLSARRVAQIVSSAAVAREVGTSGSQAPQIGSERQARQLQQIPPGQRAGLWGEAVARSGGAQPPAGLVRDLIEKAKAGMEPSQLAEIVRGQEARARSEAEQQRQTAKEEDTSWRVGSARWHVGRARRQVEVCGPEAAAEAMRLLDLADAAIVAAFGDVEPQKK